MRTPIELAWAAGFFDGEGHVSARKGQTAAWRMVVQANQCDRRVLDRFRAAVGVGYILGPYKKGPANHRDTYMWRVAGFEQSQAVVAMLWPFLSEVKREQALTALRAMRDWHRDRDEWCRKRLHRFADVGRTSWGGSCRGCYDESRKGKKHWPRRSWRCSPNGDRGVR